MAQIMLKRLLAPPAAAPLPAARLPLLPGLLLVFVAYLAVAQLTMAIGTAGHGLFVPFWPPAGIALAALVLGGGRLWPAVLLATLGSALISGFAPLTGLLMGAGNALGAWAGYRLLRGPLQFDPRLGRPQDVLHLCFSAPVLGGAISASLGVCALSLGGSLEPAQLLPAWRGWWVGDLAGTQLLAPLLLAWLQPREGLDQGRWRHLAVAAVVAAALSSLWFFSERAPESFAYAGLLLLLTLIWIAFSCELRLVTLALATTALTAAVFAALGTGPFANIEPQLVQVKLQVLIASLTAVTLALAAANRQRRSAEEDRNRAEERLEQVLDSLDDVIWTLEAEERRFSFVSGATQRLSGHSAAELYANAMRWADDLYPADREATLAAFERQFAGEAADQEFRIIRDGEVRWLRVRSHPVVVAERVVRIHGITQDVTSLHRAMDRLAASEERLRRALGASEVGVWDWAVETGNLQFVLAVADGNGYRLAERSVGLAEWEASLHPEDRTRAMQALLDCRDGRSLRFRCEYRTHTRHGHWRWFRGEGQVVDSADGQARHLAGTFRDIHERKQVEAELEKLSMAVEQNPSVVFITDAQGRFEYCNQAFSEVTGYGLEDILEQTPRLLKSGLNEVGTYADLWRTINAGKTWRGRLLNRRRDGSIYVCLQAIAPIRDANGRITHFVSISQDLSELQESPDLWPPRRRS